MAKSTKKTKRESNDVNVMAFDIVNELTAERPAQKKKQKPVRKTTRKASASKRTKAA